MRHVTRHRPRGRSLLPLLLQLAIRDFFCAASPTIAASSSPFEHGSPIETYFDGVTSGPGVWKWRHYFDVYHKHLARFRGTDVHFAEIGIYSGGSLRMWREYFGERASIIGVDIANATLAYDGNPRYGSPRIHIGDQSDDSFWRDFKQREPRVDVLIDDGSHLVSGQNATLTAALEHLSSGGVYICEDVHGHTNTFLKVVTQLLVTSRDGLHVMSHGSPRWQRHLGEVAFYPYMVVIEILPHPRRKVLLQRHGTEWQPPCRRGETNCFASLGARGTGVKGKGHAHG